MEAVVVMEVVNEGGRVMAAPKKEEEVDGVPGLPVEESEASRRWKASSTRRRMRNGGRPES